jgi:hypothetical protein
MVGQMNHDEALAYFHETIAAPRRFGEVWYIFSQPAPDGRRHFVAVRPEQFFHGKGSAFRRLNDEFRLHGRFEDERIVDLSPARLRLRDRPIYWLA